MDDANGNHIISLDRLKRDAKRHKKAHGGTHVQALDLIAKQRGYAHWPALVRAVDGGTSEVGHG